MRGPEAALSRPCCGLSSLSGKVGLTFPFEAWSVPFSLQQVRWSHAAGQLEASLASSLGAYRVAALQPLIKQEWCKAEVQQKCV